MLTSRFQLTVVYFFLNERLQISTNSIILFIQKSKPMSESISRPLNQSLQQSIEPIKPVPIKRLAPDRSSVNQVYEEELPVLINKPTDDSTLYKRYKIITGVGICCLIFGLILFLALPPLIHMAIVKGAIDQAVLSPDNENFWAHFPGQSNTIITRNYSFFNLANAQQFFLKGQKPRFLQAEGYIITEKEDYLNIKYSQDMAKVKFVDWLHFDEHEDSRSLEENFNILNLPALGFWYTLKNSRDPIILIQGFALLFTSIQESIIDTVIGQGISSQYFPDFDTTYGILQQAGISRENSKFLWQDQAYGLSNKNNLKYWVQAAQSSFNQKQTSFSESALDLKDYFTLSDFQIYYILNQVNQFAQSLHELILENHYCQNIEQCDGHQLAVRQLASSYVTFNTPPVSSISPTDTICTDNQTCTGYYPELYAYYKNVYLTQHPSGDPFLTFDSQMVGKWVNYNPTGKKGDYNKNQSCIMHIGNLDALFNNGTMHDKVIRDHFDSSQYLKNIQNRFQLPTQSHARVFWEWIKYLSTNLLRQKTQGNQKLGIANSFSSGIYDSFSYLQDHLQNYLLRVMLRNWLGQKSCTDLISTSFQTTDTTIIQKICNNYDNDIQSTKFIDDSMSVCRNKYKESWKNWKEVGATPIQLQTYCDKSVKGGFGELYHNMRKQLNDFYHCDQTPNYYCSDYEIALIQWANSSVTLNHPKSAGNELTKSLTFSSWDEKSSPIQLQYYSTKSGKPTPSFSTEKAYQLFNFDNIFSATSNLKIFKSKQTTQSWRDYMRYIVVFVGFKGLTNQRTARQYIFGYNDEYLLWRKNNYPPFGGDPSTPAYTAFNDLNITQKQANLQIQLHTGKDNSLMTAQFYKINNLTYLTTNYTRFNGNHTYWVLETPWSENDFFYGTSGKQFSPDQPNSKNVSIYVPNLQRYGSGSLNQSYPYERYGYDLQIAYLGRYIYEAGEEFPDNKKYYQHFFGVFNQTSVIGAPLFMTKHHFMNCTSNWSSYVGIYSEDASIQYTDTSHWDDSYVIVEPYTGVSFQSTIFLQGNYFHEPDELFTYNQICMLPVFSIYRSGNLTEQKANSLFKPLTTALNVKIAIFYVGIVLTLIGIGGSAYGLTNLRRLKRKNQQEPRSINNDSIKISMQPQNKKSKSTNKKVKINQSRLQSLASQQLDDE